MTIRRAIGFVLLILPLPLAPLSAQVPTDSIPVWTDWLVSGDVRERMHAAGKLAAVEQPLPDATRAAVLNELERLHDFMLDGAAIPDEEEAGPENFGEYYLNLVVMAAHFRSPQADLALVPAVGVSEGVQKRVARLGDEAVPPLTHAIDRGHDPAGALGALALAWFWADSTGAPLSSQSRHTILTQLIAAARHDDATHQLGAAVALEYLKDPAILPLVRSLESDPAAEQSLALGWLRAYTIPTLEGLADEASDEDLARASRRLLAIVCADAVPAPRRGLCESLDQNFDAVTGHLQAGRTGPASEALREIIRRADGAAARDVISPDEHAIIAGGARQVLARL